MLELINDKIELKAFIAENGDYSPETNYISQDRKSGECFAIIGCTHASEAFRFVNEQYRLVVTDDYSDQIAEQLNSECPELNGFLISEGEYK